MATMRDVNDPARRELLQISEQAQAENGMLTQEDVDKVDVKVPSQFDEPIQADGGVRESILAGVNANFENQLERVQESALQNRRFNVGSTSEAELRAARASRNEAIGKLGEFESQSLLTQMQLDGRIDQIQAQGIQDRLNIGSQGATEADLIARRALEERASIVTAGGEERLTQQQANESAMARLQSELEVKREELAASLQEGAFNRELQREVNQMQMILTREELANRLDVAGVGANTQLTIATLAANTDMSIAELAAATDVSIADAQLAMEKVKIDNDLVIQQRYATVEERRTAVAEKDQAATESLNLHRFALDQKLAEHGMKAEEASITGIWEEYGVDEMSDFESAMNTAIGEDGYNARYDFDSNGSIDFKDFISFSQAATLGGIPTVQLQQLREGTRQFDISQEQNMNQFMTQIEETAREFNLSHAQQRDLAVMSLAANESVANAQLNVQHLSNLMDLLVDAPEALSPEDGASIIAAAFDLSAVQQSMDIPSQSANSAISAISLINDRKGTVGTQMAELVLEGDVWNPDVFDMSRRQDPNVAQAYSKLDFNGDGIVDMDDYVIYTVNGGQSAPRGKLVVGGQRDPEGNKEREQLTNAFKQSFNSKTGDANYQPAFDYDNDGDVDFKDFIEFGNRG